MSEAVPWDLANAGMDDLVAAVGVVAAVVVLALIVLILLPLAFFVLEALIVVGGVLLLRGTWVVEAVSAWPTVEEKRWKVRG
jgi:hypothetical protein